ncbi:hypothetical protein N301_14804, partial [Charadrius vociferus]
LEWLTDKPVWVDQWPLTEEKLAHIHHLVEEQQLAGHTRPSNSPWNTPIFTIPKKLGKWRLLHDLRAVNAVMKDMGALQPGLPSPIMIPKEWNVLIIDLKDCFFTIPLHPHDCEKFAFSVPAINKSEPLKRCKRVVLPQGMKNSPTICQLYVSWALQPLWKRFSTFVIYHYMDDILIAGKELNPNIVVPILQQELAKAGLVIAPEKVQQQSPIKAFKAMANTRSFFNTQSDVQKLIGDIQWVRAICGITNGDLAPLMPLLKGSPDVGEPRQLSQMQKKALQNVIDKISMSKASQWNPELPVQAFI